MADVSTLTETIKTQRLVYDELSKEYDRDRSLLRGDIKVLRRSMKATEEAVSSNRQTMDSCTTSITYLRGQVQSLEGKIASDANPIISQTQVMVPLVLSLSEQNGQYTVSESVDFNEHETSVSEVDSMILKRRVPVSAEQSYVEFSNILRSKEKSIKRPIIQEQTNKPNHGRMNVSPSGPSGPISINRKDSLGRFPSTQGEPVPFIRDLPKSCLLGTYAIT